MPGACHEKKNREDGKRPPEADSLPGLWKAGMGGQQQFTLQGMPVQGNEKTESGIILPDSAKEKSQEAVVIAVGPGKCKDRQKAAMQVKEGDKVIISEYGGTEVKIGDEEYKIVIQDDILAIVE